MIKFVYFFFINNTQKSLKPSKNMFQFQGWMRKTSYPEISSREYRRKHEMKFASKKVYWKNNRVLQTLALRHIAIEKNIFSELNRCIFKMSLKYIKLAIPKILFILVICNFNFYFKITWPSPTNLPPPPTKIKVSDLPLSAKT